MENFYISKEIVIEIENPHSEIKLRMRPLKIHELPLYFSAIEESKKEGIIHLHLIHLLKNAIDKNIDELPITILSDLLIELSNLSFSRNERNEVVKEWDTEFADMLDFLISQGHSYSDILEYTCPQFRRLLDAATNRILGKKKKKIKNPLKLLTSLGVPVRTGVKNNGR